MKIKMISMHRKVDDTHEKNWVHNKIISAPIFWVLDRWILKCKLSNLEESKDYNEDCNIFVMSHLSIEFLR